EQDNEDAYDIASIHTGNQSPDKVRALLKKHWPRLQTPDKQAPEHYGSSRRAWNAQGNHREQRRHASRVGGSFWGEHAFQHTSAKLFRGFREFLGNAVTHKRGGGSPARLNAHPGTNECRAHKRLPIG